MANITYELIFKFASGKEVNFIDVEHTFSIVEDYRSPVLLTPQIFGIDDLREYYALLLIDGRPIKDYALNYCNYKNFGDSIVDLLNNKDTISEIILRDTDTKGEYFHISSDQLVGIEAGGGTDRGMDNVMVYRIQIYYKKNGKIGEQ